MTDDQLTAFGEECVTEAAPEIAKEATTELRIENAGLKASGAVLKDQRDDALKQRDTERKKRGTLETLLWVISYIGGILLAADFIFGWWRFGK